jgi:hypothetical protein
LFRDFTKFVRRTAREQEEIMDPTGKEESISQSEDRDPQDICIPVRLRSDSGIEEEVSTENADNTMDASLPVSDTGRLPAPMNALFVERRIFLCAAEGFCAKCPSRDGDSAREKDFA